MSVRIGPFMGIAACLCLLTGWGFTLVGVDELHETLHSSAKPVEITDSQLRAAIFKLIACPGLFVLGMVLAVLAALRPDPAPDPGTLPLVGVLGDAVRWLHRRGYFSGGMGVFLTAAGLAAVGAATFVWYRDWDDVGDVKNEMHLLFAVCGGLIGLGLIAYAALIGYARWRTAPVNPAPAFYQRVQGAHIPVDRQQMAVAVMVVGLVLLAVAANHVYRSAISTWTYVVASLGGLVLAGGIVWCGFLDRKKRQEPAHFWNKTESQ